MATRHGQCIAMKQLIDAGCDLNVINDQGWSALHYACQKATGYQILLNAGADPDVKDKDNITPIIVAASEGFDGVVRSLVDANCNVNIAVNSVGRTALHILSFKGHSQCINNLVYGGANIDVKDSLNRTPLWYAIKNRKTDVVRLILKSYSHADTFECSTTLPSEDCPAELAFREKLLACVKFFILAGYDYTHVRECLQKKELSYWLDGSDEFSHWLEFASGAQTLKQICRKWIRHHLGTKFFHHLQFLPVPEVIRNYLYLEELHDH